jgi:hypothetical protein
LEQYLADRKVSVGDDASGSQEARMVEIRVAVADGTVAQALMLRLVGHFDRSCVSIDWVRNEVRIRSEWESRAVVDVIGTVESWLAADHVGSAKLSLGDRSYTMVGPTRLATAGGPA